MAEQGYDTCRSCSLCWGSKGEGDGGDSRRKGFSGPQAAGTALASVAGAYSSLETYHSRWQLCNLDQLPQDLAQRGHH